MTAPIPPAGEKRALRKRFRAARASTPPAVRKGAEDAAVLWLGAFLESRPGVSAIAAYFSVGDEFPTARIIGVCHERGRSVCLPRWDGQTRQYSWARFSRGGLLRNGPMGIPEPEWHDPVPASEIGLYLVPGLAFDLAGTRLGYGGGWYDRLLSSAAPDAVIYGLCFPSQISESPLPREPHDIPVFPLPAVL